MVGAAGGVGGSVALGLAALSRPGADTSGLVTARNEFEPVRLIAPRQIVFGGHEIRSETLTTSVKVLHHESGLFDASLLQDCAPVLRRMQRNIRPGTMIGAGPTVTKLCDRADVPKDTTGASAVRRLAADIQGFRDQHKLTRVVVIHAASSEPTPALHTLPKSDFAELGRLLRASGACPLPTSSIYALAAIEAGAAYINFTPSTGIDVRALCARARSSGLPYMGRDGKTGETLVKSALAPMFATRNLRVLSWVGQNILGNRDGAVLSDPDTRSAKIRSKQRTLRGAGATPTGPDAHVSIDYVPSLADWKIAWDFIHFSGFLGTKMSLQFTWQGADSALAAPLLIDLARLTELEMRRGAAGVMKHLGFFFKDPMGTDELDLFAQWQTLLAHVVPPQASDRRVRDDV